MISQLQNSFRTLRTAILFSTAAMSLPMTAMAENVSAEFVTTDWLIFAKVENSELTELSRHGQGPAMIAAANTSLTLNASADNFEGNYLYILVGNRRGDGVEPYLAGRLSGTKSVVTGNRNISVMDSGFKDVNPPADISLIQEIIENGFGGGPFTMTAPTRVGGSSKAVNGDNIAAVWSPGQNENGAVNVFRIPYSALIIPPPASVPINVPDPITITEYVQDPDLLADRDRLRDERKGMVDYIAGLTTVITGQEDTIRELKSDVLRKTNAANSTLILLQTRDNTIAAMQAELDKKAPSNVDPVIPPAPPALIPILLGGLGVLSLGGLLGFLMGRRRKGLPKADSITAGTQPLLPAFLKNLRTPKNSSSFDTLKKGMCFASSPMALGGLPMSLAVIKPVYDAVGRIGFAQEGKPVGKDESFGTGILVSDRHILTNRHVWEMFKTRLAGEEGTGIEFYGEKKSDKSEFIAFDGAEPMCIEGWDAAIFTLSRSPENRPPVSITSRPAEELNDLDIVVVGYPQAHRVTEDIAAVTEKDPVFGVKRYSAGKIFRHSVDIENPYGVEAAVEEIINPAETLRAICHNASTLGGSSGSAVICKKTGDLIALHFGFDSAYEWKEAANFALAGEDLAHSVANITNSMTPATDKTLS